MIQSVMSVCISRWDLFRGVFWLKYLAQVVAHLMVKNSSVLESLFKIFKETCHFNIMKHSTFKGMLLIGGNQGWVGRNQEAKVIWGDGGVR